jgi:CRISPR-associated endonuclease/helicase Cas3
MTVADFTAFYTAVHHPWAPFPWQQRLAAQVLEKGSWPDRISVPTACGKTSVLDVAVFALAAQADLGLARTAPMRIFFVVDRRLVVDDVTTHANKIHNSIMEGSAEITRWVRTQLKKYGAGDPLSIATLRGGMYRSDSWADEPNQPLICASTVDQVGSRLLFRGYGVSDSRRPVDAGLVGNDSLIILDEAHLSNPFLTTLRAVGGYQALNENTCRPLQMVEMSATVRGGSNVAPAVTLSAEDLASSLGDRLSREKRVLLKEVSSLETGALEDARRVQADGAPVVAIVMNSVASARAIFEQIPASSEKILLTGRIRPYDRDVLLKTHLDRMKAHDPAIVREPLIVVATQTIEAGADLDFDALVTELAPLDCLVQRFGRLNRIGSRYRSEGIILRPKRSKEDSHIYGDAPEKTWQWLSKQAPNGSLDFCASALGDLLQTGGTEECMSPAASAPFLLPAHLDAWVQTNPAPADDPDVAPFLHGALKSGEVQIVWRADLPEGKVADWTEIVTAVPPLSTEALPIPIGAARRWLSSQGAATVTDTESDSVPEQEEKSAGVREFLIWRGPENSKANLNLRDLRPGDTVIVRSAEGGCDRFGWNPESKEAVPDIGDLCNNERARQGRGRYRFRLYPAIFYPRPEQQEQRGALQEFLGRFGEDNSDAEDELHALVQERLKEIGALAKGRLQWYSDGIVVWISKWPSKQHSRELISASAETPPEESDENPASSFTVCVTLDAHTKAVVKKAEEYAAVTSGDGAAAAILRAASMHDLGKLDDRFQMALDPWRAHDQPPLAKSGGTDASEYGRALRRAGYPKGGRHEFASVLIAERAPAVDGCDRELVLYLIGTHHGQGRPLVPFWSDAEDPQIRAPLNGKEVTVRGAHRMARLDSGWVERFWNLNRVYGWWGLAFLEAILRRADCVVSRREQEQAND